MERKNINKKIKKDLEDLNIFGLTYNQIYEAVRNKEGGTFGDHKRYIISISNRVFKFEDLTFEKLKQEIDTLRGICKKLNIECIGFWNEDNNTYLDVNVSTDNKKDARATARVFNQKAFYDSKYNKVIFTAGRLE